MNDASVRTLAENDSKMNIYVMHEDPTARWMDAIQSGNTTRRDLSPNETQLKSSFVPSPKNFETESSLRESQ